MKTLHTQSARKLGLHLPIFTMSVTYAKIKIIKVIEALFNNFC